MEIKKKFLQKYLHNIAIEQITEEYKNKGYSVSQEEKIGNYRADLIVRKHDEIIVIEVKSGKMTPERKKNIIALGNYVREQKNYKFIVAIATPPKEKKLEIVELECLLEQNINENLPSELDELSSHTRVEEVNEVDVDEISINENSIFVKGNGVVNVELQMGSTCDQHSENGICFHDNFPFDFEITLKYDDEYKLIIYRVDKLKFNTSDYYSLQ